MSREDGFFLPHPLPIPIAGGRFPDPPRERPLAFLTDAARGQAQILCPPENWRFSGSLTKELCVARGNCVVGEPVGVTFAITTAPQIVADEGPYEDTEGELVIALPRGVVSWGVGDITIEAVFDLLSGSGVCVACENMTVHARYDVRQPPWANPPTFRSCPMTPAYRVSAALAYGPTSRGMSTYTEIAYAEHPAQGDTPADAMLIGIPAFAQSFTVLPVGGSKVTATLLPANRGYPVSDAIQTPLTNVSQTNSIDQIPIPNGMRWVEVANANGEDDPAMAYVVFGLSI